METALNRKNILSSYFDLFILIFGLLVSFLLWKASQNFLLHESKIKLASKIDLTQKSIENEILAYENALYGLRGLFVASPKVESEEFDFYVEELNFKKQYPSAHTFTFVSVEEDEKTGKEIFLVKYAYPIKLTLGQDLKKSEERREALEKAIVTREITFSKPLFIEGIEKKGFIATLPIFSSTNESETIGFINAIFLEDEFLDNITKDSNEILETHIYIDGKLAYDSLPGKAEENKDFLILGSRNIEIGGVSWKFDFFGNPKKSLGQVESNIPIAILITGILFTFLFFGITYSLSGSYKRAQLIAKEITSHLLESEKKLQAIINSMGEGLFVLDENHKIEFINPPAEKMLEMSSSEVIGKDWAEVVTTYRGEKLIPYNDRSTVSSLQGGKVIVTNLEDDHYYLTKSGKKFPITSTTTPLMQNGRVIGAIKAFRDASSDKRSKKLIEEEVTRRTAQLTASINSMSLGFIMTDVRGAVTLSNHAAVKMLKENLPKNLSDLSNLLAVKPSLEILASEAHRDKKLLEIEEVNFENKIYHVYISPVTASVGADISDIGTVFLIDDITEEKIIDRSRDEFFSIASHELRTPLTAIRGNTSLIQEHFADKIKDGQVKEMLNDIHDSSVRLIGIVNDFLNVSRLEMGRMEFKKEKVDLGKLTKEVVEEMTVTAQNKKLKLFSSGSGVAIADKERVKQVLINLVGNSINYTESGEIEIEIVKNKVLVKDTGRGIAPENQNLLFHNFQQAGSSLFTRDTTKGTGLGLYISRLMVEGMGGKIWLEKSEEGKGSTFAFSLPKS